MRWLRRFWLRVGGVFSGSRRERAIRDFDEELESHIALHAEDNVLAGMTPAEARRAAVLKLGGVEVARQARREGVMVVLMENLFQDVKYAVRQLRKTPGFTITAVLTLALGIGANAAIFTLVNAVLLKNLPVADPKTLVHVGDNAGCCIVGEPWTDGDATLFSMDAYEQLKKSVPEFQELAAMQAGYRYLPAIARREGKESAARSVVSEFVSGNYFRTFGVRPEAGRLFLDSDDVVGAPMTAVMSYDAWKNEYGGDAGVVGGTFWVNTKAVTVVGIAPEGFYGDRLSTDPPDFYLPLNSMDILANQPYIHNTKTFWLYLIGRVKPGVAMAPLQQKVSALTRGILASTSIYSSADGKKLLPKVHVVLTPGGAGIEDMQGEYKTHLTLLMWIAGFVLLIACANIANLLLVRGMARKTEMSVRAALGGMRWRIVRQLLTESLVLATVGGVVGIVVAYGGARMLLMMAFPGAENVPIHATPSLEVIGFTFGLAMMTGIVFGIAPAWTTARAEPADALRSGARTTTGSASFLQRGLVIAQAALSLVLLVVAGLFSQSLGKLQNSDMKLDATNHYIVHFNPQGAGYLYPQLEGLYREMAERFHAVPGVVKVGISSYTPMERANWQDSVQVLGMPDPHEDASFVKVNAEYFDSVGTKVVMGRGFTESDTSTSPAVAVVNEAFVKKFLPGRNPIGHRFGRSGAKSDGDYEIVGVVEDTAYGDVGWANHTMFFLPMMQRGASETIDLEKDSSFFAGTIVVETARPMAEMGSLARKTLAGINPNLSVVKFQTFGAQIAEQFSEARMLARLTMLFGVLALMLAAIGLYGVTAYTVARRTGEIGIRMALGAERFSVVAMVMRGVLWQALIGLGIGVPVALGCVRFVKAELYEVSSVNLAVMGWAVFVLGVAAVLAGGIPARRAASVEPSVALRN
jgi:macrolide transport system ATP-binding/permease protein